VATQNRNPSQTVTRVARERPEAVEKELAMFIGRVSVAFLLGAAVCTVTARADIYRWDNGQVIPGTEGITPGPGVQLTGRQLEFAELFGMNLTDANFGLSNLTNAHFYYSTLTNADLSETNLCGANFYRATLTNADLTESDLNGTYFWGADLTRTNLTAAIVAGANFGSATSYGFTKEQLYSTASYAAKDLRGIGFGVASIDTYPGPGNDLTGWDFNEQDLTGADFAYATLTKSILTRAVVVDADFSAFGLATGLVKQQLYSTASYLAKDLGGIKLVNNDLTGWDFSGQNLTRSNLNFATLTNANLSRANLANAMLNNVILTGANLTGAVVAGGDFSLYSATSSSLAKEQLYSTASYQTKDLRGIGLSLNNLTGWEFTGQNLTNANLKRADARGASGLNVVGAFATNLIQPDGRIAGLNLAAGEKLVAYADVPIPVQVLGGFAIAPDTAFDLTNNDLIVRATAVTKDALYAVVQAKIKSGQNGVDGEGLVKWDGFGVTSSAARAANVAAGVNLVGLGVIRNSDLDITTGLPGSSHTTFSGRSVSPHDVLVKYTYTGDGNLDGAVTFDDYAAMDAAFFGLIPNLGWATGDINFDGLINFDDYSAVDQAFFFQGARLSRAEMTPVPEPASIGIVAFAVIFLAAFIRSHRMSFSGRV
jgi:uncharacterized protein YjbI with pentapeptide repeats